jgi:glycosyltransferase involved in cell wall biosynthesis
VTGDPAPLRILHVLAPARYGGLESVVHTLANGQRAAGHDVTVVGIFSEAPRDHPFWSGMRATIGERAVPVIVPARGYLAERRAIRRLLGDEPAQILHTHGYRPDVLVAPEGRRAGAATITTVHGFGGGRWKNRTYEWLQRRAFRRFDGVVAVSAKLAGELVAAGVPQPLVHCVPNAWAPVGDAVPRETARERLLLPADVPVIGWVGRMSGAKAPDVMVDAFARVEHRDALLSFVGDGPLRSSIELGLKDVGPASRIRWHGMVPDAGRLIPAFDVLAITSRTEGTPMVLLEAMAAGVPVVATAVGGIPDVISDREAVLVESGDAPGIARAIDSILANAAAAEARAAAARARLRQDFNVARWVDRYDRIYRSCLAAGRRSR